MTPVMKLFYKTPEGGAQTQIMLAVEPELEKTTGKFFNACVIKESSAKSQDDALADWLWDHSTELTKLKM